jgi:hypothetical protein
MAGYGEQPPMPPYLEPRSRRRSGGLRTGLIIGVLSAVVVIFGGGAAGMNAYAKHTICSSLKSDNDISSDSGSSTASTAATEAADMDKTATELRRYGKMLVLSRGLHKAVDGLADDIGQMATLTRKASADTLDDGDLASVATLAASVNTHAEAAQTACGLPATEIFHS